ncbi:MAG: hypothetical protein ACOCP8_02415 [archaeon]
MNWKKLINIHFIITIILIIIIGITANHYYTEINNQKEVIQNKKEEISQLQNNIETIKTKKEKTEEINKEVNQAKEAYKEKVLELDTYMQYVTGQNPRLLIKDLAGNSEIIDYGVEEALNNSKYEQNVKEDWEGEYSNEKFVKVGEKIARIYNYIVQNVEYKSDNKIHPGYSEVYIPPDSMIKEIKNKGKTYGDCEDTAILTTTMLSHLKKKNPKLPIENIIVKEGEVEGGGHGWMSLRVPHPKKEGEMKEITIETTQTRDEEHVPWDTWIEGSPNARKLKNDTITYTISIFGLVIDEKEMEYPLQGYDNGYHIEEEVWRNYGLNEYNGHRSDYKYPDKNIREINFRGDPLLNDNESYRHYDLDIDQIHLIYLEKWYDMIDKFAPGTYLMTEEYEYPERKIPQEWKI